MKVTFYDKNGALIQTLWGGTVEHIKHTVSLEGFNHAITYAQLPHTLVYKQTDIQNTPQEAVLAVIQLIDAPLLSDTVLTNYLP